MNFDFNIGNTKRPSVRITQRCFSFNKNAIELLGYPKYIAIGLDKENKKIAFKPLAEKTLFEPCYKFAIFESITYVSISASEIRKLAIELMSEKPQKIGVSFALELDEETKFGVIKLIKGVKPQGKPFDVNY
ncbi:MAG: hypothetical protein FWE22_04080 [Firmicutes bacterium]|nr:hypothetical protein [Bacillota bacterium]